MRCPSMVQGGRQFIDAQLKMRKAWIFSFYKIQPGATCICNNVGGTGRHYGKWNKQSTERQMKTAWSLIICNWWKYWYDRRRQWNKGQEVRKSKAKKGYGNAG